MECWRIATNPWRMLQGTSGVDSNLRLGAGTTGAPLSISRQGVASRDCPAAPARSRAAGGMGAVPGQAETGL